MPKPVRVTALDVGHGCCTVLRDERGTLVFDYPRGPIPGDYFRSVGVTELDAAFISHTHRDHCEGLTTNLGGELPVGVIFMNPRRGPNSQLYRQLLVSLEIAKAGPRPPRLVRFNPDVREDCLDRGDVQIRILSPSSALDFWDDSPLWTDEHASCGVVRIDCVGGSSVLLPGDLSERGLRALETARGVDLSANVLVFPHHGGLPGTTDAAGFAERLTSLVQPDIVIFSQQRDEEGRPRPEIVKGVRRASAARIACTQLSWRCDERELHLEAVRSELTLPAAGVLSPLHACCAGSFDIDISGKKPRYVGSDDHQGFVEGQVQTPMCLNKFQATD